MRLWASVRIFVLTVSRRSDVERDMDEELRAHIQNRIEDLERSGLPRPEAERRARYSTPQGALNSCSTWSWSIANRSPVVDGRARDRHSRRRRRSPALVLGHWFFARESKLQRSYKCRTQQSRLERCPLRIGCVAGFGIALRSRALAERFPR